MTKRQRVVPPLPERTNQIEANQPPGDGAPGACRRTNCPRDRRQIWPRVVVLTGIAFAGLSIAQARAETPTPVCTGNAPPQPIPASLTPAINALFGINMPPEDAVATTVFRCVDGRMLVCTVGANLPCGPANTSRVPKSGVVDWCHGHPNEPSLPAAVVGHDTMFAWQCQEGVPRITRQVLDVDDQGFIKQYWKVLR